MQYLLPSRIYLDQAEFESLFFRSYKFLSTLQALTVVAIIKLPLPMVTTQWYLRYHSHFPISRRGISCNLFNDTIDFFLKATTVVPYTVQDRPHPGPIEINDLTPTDMKRSRFSVKDNKKIEMNNMSLRYQVYLFMWQLTTASQTPGSYFVPSSSWKN